MANANKEMEMNSTMFLSESELYRLTGYELPKCQAKWLRANGIKFLINCNGHPIVLIKAVEAIMGIKATNDRKTQPNENALRALMAAN